MNIYFKKTRTAPSLSPSHSGDGLLWGGGKEGFGGKGRRRRGREGGGWVLEAKSEMRMENIGRWKWGRKEGEGHSEGLLGHSQL